MIARRRPRAWFVSFLALGTVTVLLQALGWETIAGAFALAAFYCLVRADL